jgi:hypothetical protein
MEIQKAESLAGWLKIVPLRSRNCVRRGNLMPVTFAGLLAELFAVVMIARTGKKK